MICYKVVSCTDLRFQSYLWSGLLNLFYELGQVTKPKVGGIFVFETLECAKLYMETGGVILKCKCPRLKRITEAATFQSDYLDFWNGKEVSIGPTPSGSRLTGWVEPFEIIFGQTNKEVTR